MRETPPLYTVAGQLVARQDSTYFSYAERRYNRSLGRCREIDARQPLASTDGCQTLSFRGACFWLVFLQAGQQRGEFVGHVSGGLIF
jgi:hypothetical protein